jgi:hypothetical protein
MSRRSWSSTPCGKAESAVIAPPEYGIGVRGGRRGSPGVPRASAQRIVWDCAANQLIDIVHTNPTKPITMSHHRKCDRARKWARTQIRPPLTRLGQAQRWLRGSGGLGCVEALGGPDRQRR